ncbi:MAG: SOS response-associated peptidase family protein [Alphaproteobacteria bacterium]|nr:SOS response-associated peptidase family protein [Alphaproteobacteria bacterium]MBU0793814.1 SOS response-associated peptidase family protein [Alphaproteobacteria bacterium]MBU0874388.1 SOS response-associated peptidase family protein [Alphaproteobacteria bacterium]MBU1768567.1 SOS response-associated peptidase family protein [Alphaproteobacteria bacterium]
MCNLYNLRVSREEVNRHFNAPDDPRSAVQMDKDYVAPGKPGLVVREQDGARVTSAMLWGFPFNGRPVTNVRNYTSPFWKSALVNPERRCLVPVTEFQEWSVAPMPETGKKRPFWFRVPSEPIFAFAGIWRPTEGDPVFSFLTCGYDGDPAAHIVGAVHPKACPVILHPEDYERWLSADLDEALSLAVTYPSQLMAMR